VPPYAGALTYAPQTGETSSLGLLQGLVPNQGDVWSWTLEDLDRYYETCSLSLFVPPHETGQTGSMAEAAAAESALARDHVGLYLDAAATLGRRTAELHLALAGPTSNPEFAPEPLTSADLQQLAATFSEHVSRVLDALRGSLLDLPDALVEQAGRALARRQAFGATFRRLEALTDGGQRTRIHGDYHLGQVLRVKNDFLILDFEGEPQRSLAERRAKHSPLKDVAGMLRSFSYAAWVGLQQFTRRGHESAMRLEPWARLWEQSVSAAFLRAYLEVAAKDNLLPREPAAVESILQAYVLEKAFYEVLYELNHRPAWVWIPLRSLLTLSV
jgi:maltose alpha-D-glucosyltransferase/alpha-amylase